MRLKVIHENGKTSVVNAESGEAIKGVAGVSFSHHVKGLTVYPPKLVITVVDFDLIVQGEATVKRIPAH